MARTPWATIKLCLPSWLAESAPYKQAFVFFLVMLSPSLFLSPFLLSPLLTLLLLTSATVAGALSAWMTTKVTRTILAHSSPLPPTPVSCLKSLVHIMSLKIINPLIIRDNFPWLCFWFDKILASSNKDTAEDGSSHTATVAIGKPTELSCSPERIFNETENEKASDLRCQASTATSGDALNVVKLRSKSSSDKEILEEVKAASEGGKERLSLLEFGRGGVGSVYFRGAVCGTKGFRPKKNDSQLYAVHRMQEADASSSHSKHGSDSDSVQKSKYTESALIQSERIQQGMEDKKISEGEDNIDLKMVNVNDQSLFDVQPLPRTIPPEMAWRENMEGLAERKSMKLNDEINIKGCTSHSWCKRGVDFEEEMAFLMEDIHKLCLGKWYPNLSTDESFPSELKVLLEICLKQAACLGSRCDVPSLAEKLGSLFLCHLREFRKARRRKRAAETMTNTTLQDELRKSDKSVCVEKITLEESSSKKIDTSDHSAKADLVQAEDITNVKGQDDHLLPEEGEVKMELKKDHISMSPQSVTPHLVTLTPASIQSVLAKQKTVVESGIGEEAYYRYRFGQPRGPKDLPRNYLLNVSMYIVKNIIDRVGKVPSCPLERYFAEGEACLTDTPPGKVLTSLVARKIILPMIETVSDPSWLNLRIANLLVEHAKAKLHLDSERSMGNIPYITGAVVEAPSENNGKDIAMTEGECLLSPPIMNETSQKLDEANKDSKLQDERRKSLSLPLEISSSSTVVNPIDGRISTVLGGIISATAAPLLPDNAKVSYKPIKRMWSSPSIEEGKELDGEPELKKKMRPFGRNIVDGLPVENNDILATSAQDVLCTTGSEEVVEMESVHSSKELKSSQRKARLSLSSRNPQKRKFLGLPFGNHEPPGTSSQGILFRSKSIHSIQNGKDGAWHVEEGSELHEGACLSDEPISPVIQEKGSWERPDWKPNRSRSFHGMKSYSRHREEAKLEREERVGKEMGRDASENFTKGMDRQMPRVSSEGSMRENSGKSLEESKAELTEGLGARWMKYALGKWDTQWTSEGDSDELNRLGANSLDSSLEKGEKQNAIGSGTSLSEGYISPDMFKLENKFWSSNDSNGKVVVDNKGSTEMRSGSDSEERKESTIYHSSPIPSAIAGEDGGKEIPKDISPVYEEVEDLPSTIAKLKAFLKERNGKIGETTPPPDDEMKKESEIFPTSDFSLDQESNHSQKPPSPLEERPYSWPSDGGIFLNVRIPYTEICKGSSTSQFSSASPQVLYCIKYDAAYPEEGADAAAANLVVGEQAAAEGIIPHSNDKEPKDSMPNSENDKMVPASRGTTIRHVLVKRTFQEFLDLNVQLEADPLWRQALKGLKGPSRWLSLPFGKTSASTVAGRRTLLQAYLRGVCTSMPPLASSSKALRTFMAYQVTSTPAIAGGTLPSSVERILPLSVEGGEGPVPRIDKLFARTVSGMFNTLKTALPGFDSTETTQVASVTSTSSSPNPPSHASSHFDSSSAPATLNESKGSTSNPGTIRGTTIQLPAFLQFGNNNTSRPPDLVDWDMEYGEKDTEGNLTAPGSIEGLPAKNYSLEEDIQTYLNILINSVETKTDTAEFAYEALNPSTIYEDGEEVGGHRLPSYLHKVLERQYTVDSADEDGEEEELDAFLPLAKVTIDILCEALRGTGSWVSQGTVVHASKVIIGSYIENKLQEFLDTVTTKEMWCQYIHILRVAVFHHAPSSSKTEISSKETGSGSVSGQQLAVAIYTAFPAIFRQIVGNQQLLEASKFMAESLQNRVILKDLVLQVLHVCIVHLVPGVKLPKEMN